MHRPTRARSRFVVLMAAIALLLPTLTAPASAAPPAPSYPYAQKALFFASDGMRPDLMEQYAAAGDMPTYASLMASGVRGDNGMNQGFPPNTGVGWYTMMTGTWPSEHGSTNNTYHRTGEGNFNNRTSFSAARTLQADTLAASAERAGKKVAQIDWVGGAASGIAGPTVDFTNFFSTRGVLAAPLNATEQAGAGAFGISYQVAAFAPASGWTNAPIGDHGVAPPQQTTLTVATSFSSQNPTRVYDVYVYDSVVDSTPAYDTVLLVRSAALKDAGQGSANLVVGDFEEVKLTGSDGLIGARAGQTAGFYTKLISLAPDLSSFKIYFTSVQRVIATCSTTACAALPGGSLESYLANNFPTYIAADFAPLEARIINEDTYVEQGLDLHKAYADAVLYYILHDLQPDTDLAFTGFPVTDEFSHQFMGLVTPTDMDGNANPYYDDLPGNGTPDGLVATREGYIRSAYEGADEALALSRSLMGGNPTTFAGSDHGFAPQWYAVNVSKALAGLGYGPEQSSNCRAVAATLVKECHAGGTVQFYIDLAGRDPATFPCTSPGPTCSNAPQVAAANYQTVRNNLVNYFTNLVDPAHPDAKVVDRVMLKEELRNVDGSDSLHPNRSGDVVVVFRPPYQTDAATPGSLFAFSQFFGQHGYLPNLVDIPHNVNMHATFVASGPGIVHQTAPLAGVRAIDLAPTLAFLLGVPGPQNARGRIMTNLVANSASLKEITVLDVSDYHGQLIPLSESSDTLSGGGSSNPSFSIGGAAFLKPWFDAYRAEAPNGSLTVAGGDSVGASPPISSFFGDTPTIEAMNSMGFDLDALGNHNFDVNSAYLRNTLIPLANFKYLSANVVDPATGDTPPEWSKSRTFTIGGVKVAFVGFTNDDAPTLVSPTAFDPFVVTDSLAAVNKRAAQLRKQKIPVVLALGHLGATAGSTTSPTGPLAFLADNVVGVDAVIGDHTDFQVLSSRTNGVLVTENRSKGVRFTRLRLVVDTASNRVIYKTADFHKPWDIGVTADPTIQGQIDSRNAILFPILSAHVGDSTKFLPRADQCGGSSGRLCESLIGNVIAEAQRAKYGTDFGLANTGGIRADLTCPTSDNAFDFCAASLYPIPNGGLYPITVGQVLTVLPFNNVAATLTINGAELKTMLENGVSAMPGANGKFPEVAGLCFTYDIALAAGNRVTSVVRADALGNCTATPVGLTASDSYTITMNDFTVGGGDGYPNFLARATLHTTDPLDQVVADWIGANTPIAPFVKPYPGGRINCADTNGTTTPNCPTLVPSYP